MATLTRAPWPEAVLVCIAALALYALTMPHVVTFEDAGLFDSVCYTGGIEHPPGYPLFTLMCTPLYRLAFEPAMIGNTMSAVFGALSCGMLILLLENLGLGRLVSTTGGLLLAVSNSFWSQSIIVEIFTLNTLLILVTLYLCVRFSEAPSRRLAWAITFVFSLSIANHWPLTVLAFPGLLVICLAQYAWIGRQARDPRFWAITAGCVTLGLSPYLTLLLKKHLVVSFSGPIDGPRALWDYVMRHAYSQVDQQAGATIADKWHYIAWFMGRSPGEIGAIFVPFAILGILAGHQRLGWPVQAGVMLIYLASSVGLVLILGYEYEFPHQISLKPFLLVAWCAFVILAATGLDRFATFAARFGRIGAVVTAAVCAIGLIFTLLHNLPRNDRTHDTLAADYAKLVLSSVAPDAVIVSASDTDTFPMAYEHFVKGMRPDVTLLQIKNTIYPDKLPGNSVSQRIEGAIAIARARPLYAFHDVPGFPRGEDHGILVRYQPNGGPPAQRDDPVDRFRHRLVQGWLAHRFVDITEQDFVNQMLINLTTQLLALSSVEPLTASEAGDLAALERTFSGAFATLAWVVNHPGIAVPGNQLIGIALHAEDNMPVQASNLNKATFHYAFALLYLSGEHDIPVNKPLARQLLLKSFEDLPSPDTPGLCALLALGPPPGHLALTPQFTARCPGDAR